MVNLFIESRVYGSPKRLVQGPNAIIYGWMNGGGGNCVEYYKKKIFIHASLAKSEGLTGKARVSNVT